MPTLDPRDLERLELIGDLLESASTSPIGDVLVKANRLFEEIEDPIVRYLAEEAMRGIRSFASQADLTQTLFSNPLILDHRLSDIEYLQLLRINMVIHELCYACERVQLTTEATWGGSTPSRLYLNAIYYYTSSLFLVDKSKSTHKDFPLGGTIIRALHPLGLEHLLLPIKEILDEPFGETTYGDAILHFRHSDLVHGDFSPERIEHLIRKTQMRNSSQQERFAELTWRFFHRLIILHLRLLAIVASTGMDPGHVTSRYLASIKP